MKSNCNANDEIDDQCLKTQKANKQFATETKHIQ